MTDDLPDPLVAPYVDLRDFPTMPLDVRKVRDSRFAAASAPEAFRAGFLLWCASWHQVPAGSLPDDDVELSNLAGFGRVLAAWLAVKDEALSGFVRCNDGRLYHETVCAYAADAFEKRLGHFYERACDRLRKANKARLAAGLAPVPHLTFEQWNERRIAEDIPPAKAEASAGTSANIRRKSSGIPPENALKGEGEGKGERKEYTPASQGGAGGNVVDTPPAPAPEPPAPPPAPAPPPPPRKAPAKLTPEERQAKADERAAAKAAAKAAKVAARARRASGPHDRAHFAPSVQDWPIPSEEVAKAARDFPGVDLRLETAKFRDHEFRDARCDWLATWRNWIREAYGRLPAGKRAPRPTGAARQADDDRQVDELAAGAARDLWGAEAPTPSASSAAPALPFDDVTDVVPR